MNMITQLQCPAIFFTLSVANTKSLDFHTIMQKCRPLDPLLRQCWCTKNVIDRPHTVVVTHPLRQPRFFIFFFRGTESSNFYGA
jgi:hypothetical protein